MSGSDFFVEFRSGSEYDASPRRKRNAEIEIESIHAFSVALRLRHRSFRQTNHIQPVPFKGPDSVVDS